VIVRISGEGQYRLDDADGTRLQELEDAVVHAVSAGDEAAYSAAYTVLLDFVRERGSELGEDELEPSQVILPPADTSFAEASLEFTGEGLIPD